MSVQVDRCAGGEPLPALLTVEEAARVLRIGRTKAYALTREWRATGGRTGLPVVDFGSVLRVPRAQLELIVGGPLTAAPEVVAAPAQVVPIEPRRDIRADVQPDETQRPRSDRARTRRAPAIAQPALPFTAPDAS